jgi:hypothetical protein
MLESTSFAVKTTQHILNIVLSRAGQADVGITKAMAHVAHRTGGTQKADKGINGILSSRPT